MADLTPPVELVALLNGARIPIWNACERGEALSDLDLMPIRTALRRAYAWTGGDVEDLGANDSPAAARLRIALIVHYGAERLAHFARSSITTANIEQDSLEMLKQARDLVRVLERNLFKPAAIPDNIASIAQARRTKSD